MLERVQSSLNAAAFRVFRDNSHLTLLSDAVSSVTRQAAVDGSAFLLSKLASGAARLPNFLLALLFTIISLLTAGNYETVSDFIQQVIPPSAAAFTRRLQDFLRETLWQYVRAYTILMAVTFLELTIGLWIMYCLLLLPLL